jgi:hypothetical protein
VIQANLASQTVKELLKEDRLRKAYLSQYYFTLDTVDDRQYFFECDDGLRFIIEELLKQYGLQKAKDQPLDGFVYTRDYHLEW